MNQKRLEYLLFCIKVFKISFITLNLTYLVVWIVSLILSRGIDPLISLIVVLLLPISFFVMTLSLLGLLISTIAIFFIGVFRQNKELIIDNKPAIKRVYSSFIGWVFTAHILSINNMVKEYRKGHFIGVITDYLKARYIPYLFTISITLIYFGAMIIFNSYADIFFLLKYDFRTGFQMLIIGIGIILPLFIYYFSLIKPLSKKT